MKVVLLNGSPHEAGCTFTALSEVAKELNKNGVETEILQLGKNPVRGCIACGSCAKTGKCAFDDDVANLWREKIGEADGVVVGSPVYYGSANGALCAVLDRVFFSATPKFRYKAAAAVVSARRGGASAAFDRLNKYFALAEMPIVTSQYWNSVHGMQPEQVCQDIEGLQTMRTLGLDMAWMLKAIAQKKEAEGMPEKETMIQTNFIR